MNTSKTGQDWRGPLHEVKRLAAARPERPFGELAELLAPPPKDVRPARGSCRLGAEPRFLWRAGQPAMAEVVFAGLAAALGARGCGLRRVEDGPAEIELRREPRTDDESYDLRVDERGILVRSGGEAGLFRGYATLLQWLRLEDGAAIRGVQVADRPSYRHRGVLLDISRNRVPRPEQLAATIDRLAELKINQLQLYMEHSFAYRGHELVWRDAGPPDAAEIAALDAYCRARAIELVPCQNSFGHFHRWLKHPPYRHLAEVPQGLDHPFSLEPEPFSLCPLDPGSRELLADLYGQLLPLFGSRLFNSGLDETFDLGLGRSREAVAERGRAAVYVDFLEAVNALAKSHGRRMMFWGDVLLEHPELLSRLPQDGIVLQWGYEADHPFVRDSRIFHDAALEYYVCPGTSSWSSFGGRTTNALRNLAGAARAGAAAGARGLLITDWGDHGHLQPPPISWPAFFFGASCAWNLAVTNRPFDQPLERWLDCHLYGDSAGVLGGSLLRLGEVYRLTGADALNGSALFFALMMPYKKAADRRGAGMNPERLENAREALAEIRADLPRSRPAGPLGALAVQELDWVAKTLDFAARFANLRLAAGEDLPLVALPAPLRRGLAAEHEGLAEELRPLWLASSRPGGLEDSVHRFLVAARLLDGADAPA